MLRQHHHRFYVARNMVLAAAGPLKRQQVLELAERHFSRLTAGERACEKRPVLAGRGPMVELVSRNESQTELMLAFPCATEGEPDYLALMLIRSILDDGLTSWLPFHIVEKRGLAYSVHAGIDVFSDAALFEIESACAPPKVIPVVEEVLRLLGRLRDEPLSERDLARVKRRHRITLDFALDDLNALAGWYGGTELFREPETFEERCARLEAVTARQVQEVARRTFVKAGLHLCAVGRFSGQYQNRLERILENTATPRK
jgi:predicted Zn-dependent peptidase